MPTNCPAILSAYSNGCRDAQGGIRRFWITEHQNIASYTEASGALTAITMNVGKRFWLYEQELNVANVTETLQHNRQSGTTMVAQQLKAALLKRSASLSYQLRAIAHQNTCVIAEEWTGTAFILGLTRGLSIGDSASTSGTNTLDSNRYDIVLNGEEPYFAPTITSVLITSVT